MSEQQVKAGELDEAEEVFDVVLPTGDQSSKVVHPSEKPFHLPTTTVASQLPSILGLAPALSVGRD